jgi:Flp pilus assembly CpaE family ATPase
VAPAAARHSQKTLLLADLDFEAGLLRFILKVKSKYSLRDALDNMHRMDSSYWNALVSKHGEHLEFIPAPEDLSERGAPDARDLVRLLRFIRTTYPMAVVDFGRWHSTAALESLPELETLFVVVTQELHALENAREIIRMAGERGKGADRIQVLVNCVTTRKKPDLAGLESYLGIRPSAVFSEDCEALYETWSEGRLLDGDSVFGRQLIALAKSLAEPDAPSAAASLPSAALPGTAGAIVEKLAKFLSFVRRSRA